MEKQFTKNDLQTGHIVVTKSRGNAILIGNRFKASRHIGNDMGFSDIDSYNQSLLHEKFERFNIEKVYKIVDGYERGLSEIIDKLPSSNVELIWERKKEIDWRKVPKFTRVQVRDSDDSEWINRYFIGCTGMNYPYRVTWCGEFSYEGDETSTWKKIRIYDESEIKEEWYK